VFYDDVQWIKHGWINRNRILLNGKDFLFTVPVSGGSPNKLINEVQALADERFNRKFMALIESAYKKAPHYNKVRSLIESVLNSGQTGMAGLAMQSVKSVTDYLGIDKLWVVSSEISPHTRSMDKSDRLIAITKETGCDTYINPSGGKTLYNKEYFAGHGVELLFLYPDLIPYPQFDQQFVPGLSIIDAMMFLPPEEVVLLIGRYSVG
jgi:hypothetical protein